MILIGVSRAVLGKPSWQYLDFQDEAAAVDWIIEHDAEAFVGGMWEFAGGGLKREIMPREWEGWLQETRRAMADDAQHARLWRAR